MMTAKSMRALSGGWLLAAWLAVPGAVLAQDPTFQFIASDAASGYDLESGVGSVATTIDIVETRPPISGGAETQGFSMGLLHDASVLTIASAEITGELLAINNGLGPVFAGINVEPEGGDGVTIGIVYSFMGSAFLAFDERTPVIALEYDTVSATFAGLEAGLATPLEWTDALGDPQVSNIVVVDGISVSASLVGGVLSLAPASELAFLRGDANTDGRVDIADPVWVLNALFRGGPQGTCAAASDANGDGNVDQSDAVFVLNYRFRGGPQPPAPFDECGQSATGEECEIYNGCN